MTWVPGMRMPAEEVRKRVARAKDIAFGLDHPTATNCDESEPWRTCTCGLFELLDIVRSLPGDLSWSETKGTP